MASRGMKWMQQYQTLKDTDEELKHYLEESHRIVFKGITKKLQKEFGFNQN